MIEPVYQIISKRLKKQRRTQKISQENLAQVTELARTSIVNFEQGRQRLPLHAIYRIAEFLKVPIDGLFPSFEELQQTVKQPKETETVPFHGHQLQPDVAAYAKKQLHTKSGDDNEQTTNSKGKKKGTRTP